MPGKTKPELPASALFLSVEGVEGGGKSTLAQRLGAQLRRQGRQVTLTREPGGTAAGKVIRQLLLHGNAPLLPETELALFFAARAQNLAEVIRPALLRGEVVITDRFTDSTIAYQGGGRGLPLERILAVDQAVTGGFRPHLTLVLDLPVATGFSRLKGTDRIEQEAARFHRRVREGFLRIAREEPERVVVITADQTPDAVFEAAWAAVSARLR
ncbi:MAG: dTMP kinase [Acidobacteria bacterium]|nr:dTMP kinase [Acidobacteriota bacterium]